MIKTRRAPPSTSTTLAVAGGINLLSDVPKPPQAPESLALPDGSGVVEPPLVPGGWGIIVAPDALCISAIWRTRPRSSEASPFVVVKAITTPPGVSLVATVVPGTAIGHIAAIIPPSVIIPS